LHKLVGSSDQLVGMHFLGDNIGFQGWSYLKFQNHNTS
jgi:hypothetical protein